MEKPLPVDQASFFLKLLLKYILSTRVSYDKAFKAVTTRFGFPRWTLPYLYKLGFRVVNNYYAIRYLSSKYGYGVKPTGLVNFLASRGFKIKEIVDEASENAKNLSPTRRLSVTYSFPEFIVKDLLFKLDYGTVESILRSLNTRKRWLRINTLKTTIDEALRCLDETGVEYHRFKHLETIVKVKKPLWRPIGRNVCVEKGYVIPQDLSSTLVIESIKPLTPPILDACSAPGLKLSLVTSILKNGFNVVAIDLSIKRVMLEKKLLMKLNAHTPGLLLMNSDSSLVVFNRVFKLCIVDAPCSGLGVVYSDPAVKINVTKGKLEYYHERQYNILKNVLKYCEKIVFTTCSIHPLEGEAVIDRIMGENVGFIKLNKPWLSKAYPGFMSTKYTYRIMPQTYGSGGFFLAYFRKRT